MDRDNGQGHTIQATTIFSSTRKFLKLFKASLG